MYKTAYGLLVVNEPYSIYTDHFVDELIWMFPCVADIMFPNGATRGLQLWPGYTYHVGELSIKHPKVIFMVTGQGEEVQDVWARYFKNGRSYQIPGKIQFDWFDEAMLP